jgi:hypothetical protein
VTFKPHLRPVLNVENDAITFVPGRMDRILTRYTLR